MTYFQNRTGAAFQCGKASKTQWLCWIPAFTRMTYDYMREYGWRSGVVSPLSLAGEGLGERV